MDKYTLASIIATSAYDDGKWHKIPAKVQREMFGYVPFGKKSVRFTYYDNLGYCILIGYNTIMHWNVDTYTYNDAVTKINKQERFN